MPESTLEVLIKSKFDGAGALQAKAGMAELDKTTSNATVTTKAHTKATTEAKEAEKDMGKEGTVAARAMGEMGAKGAELFDRFSALAGVMGSGGPLGIAIGGALLGMGALIEVSKSSIETFQQHALAVLDFQRVTGLTAEESSKLVDTFNLFGVSGDVAAQAIYKMDQRLAGFDESGNKVTTTLTQLGVQIERTKNGSIDEIGTLENLAAAYSKAGDAAQKNAIVQEAFGRGGAALIPVLDSLGSSFQSVADAQQLVFTQEQLEQAHKFEVQSQETQQQVERLSTAIGSELAGQATSALKAISIMTDTLQHLNSQQGFNIGKAFDAAAADQVQADKAWNLKSSIDAVTTALQKKKSAEDALYSTDISAIDAAIAKARADKDVSDALNKLQDDTNKLHDDTVNYGAASQQVRDDQQNLHDETDRLRDSMVNEAKATADLAAKQADVAGTTLTASQKADIFRDALSKEMAMLDPNSPLRRDLQAYLDLLNNIPASISTSINLRFGGADPSAGGRSGSQQAGGTTLNNTFHIAGGDPTGTANAVASMLTQLLS